MEVYDCFIPISLANHCSTVHSYLSPTVLMLYLKTPSTLTEFSKSSQNVATYESCPAQCPVNVPSSSRNIPEVLWSSFGLAYPCCSGECFLEVTRRFAQAAGLSSAVLMMPLGKASTWYPPNAMLPSVYNTRYCQLIPLYTHADATNRKCLLHSHKYDHTPIWSLNNVCTHKNICINTYLCQ